MRTNLHTVLCTAIRLGAVLLAIHALEEAATVVATSADDRHHVLGSLLFSGLYFAVGVVLWLRPGMLAWWASGRSSGEVFEIMVGADDLQRVALSVLGVWLVVTGMSGLLSHGVIMVFLRERMTGYPAGQLPVAEWRWLLYYGLQAAAGAAVALGAGGLVALLRRFRQFPAPPAATTGTDTGRSP